MKRLSILIIILFSVLVIFTLFYWGSWTNEKPKESGLLIDESFQLHEPSLKGTISIEECLKRRRSVRNYRDEPLTLDEVSQLLWAAQGISDKKRGFRTAPSAGALYPLEVYIVVGSVENLPPGVYKYIPDKHELLKIFQGDMRDELCNAALGQTFVRKGALVVVFAAVYERTTRKYGQRGIRYVHIEVGHSAQNLYLQAVSLGLGTVAVGAFYDDKVRQILDMPDFEVPLYIMPVGRI